MRRAVRLATAAGGALSAALLLAGCSSGTVGQWAKAASLGSNDALLVSDVAHIRTGIRLRQLQQVRTACAAFSTDASAADGELPSPNRTLTGDLNTAYEDDYSAGEDCYVAPSFTSPKFRQFEKLLAAGSAELATAERLAAQLAPGANNATGGSGGSGGT